MRKLWIVWLYGVAVVATSCGEADPLKTTGASALGSIGAGVSERMSATDVRLPSGSGTGTIPTVGAPNSCPLDKPVVRANSNNGKTDLAWTRVAGQTRSYEVVVERNNPNVYTRHWGATTDVNDGRQGLYAQPPTLPEGEYRVRVRALRTACGPLDQGTWSDWHPFSVDGPGDNPERVCTTYLGENQWAPNGCVQP